MKGWIFLLLGVVIVGLIGAYYLQGLQQVSLEDFRITGIKEVRLHSFTVMGNLYVNNPSEVSVPIKEITYDIYLKDTGQKLSSGTLPPFILEKKKMNIIPFEHKIEWAPSLSTIPELFTQEKVFVDVKGNIRLDTPISYTISFEKEFDLKELFEQRKLDKTNLVNV